MPTTPTKARVPFNEALAALKKRYQNQITTEYWDDLVAEAHANAFTVAGATSHALVNDIADAVKSVLESGGTLKDFQADFDTIVKKHGWDYKGERGWRTGVIYRTNIRAAFAAGHWDKIEQARQREHKKGRVLYLIYETVGDNRVRHTHRAWHRIILPVDHDFWKTHYPPNGWGCRCRVRTATEGYLNARGWQPTDHDHLPEMRTENRINTQTGQIYPDQHIGIDTGWNYNVGQSYLYGAADTFGQRIMRASPEFRAHLLSDGDSIFSVLKPTYEKWAREISNQTSVNNTSKPLAFMPNKTIDRLDNSTDWQTPASALISIQDDALTTAIRTISQTSTAEILAEDIASLVEKMRRPKAIYYDTQENYLVYILSNSDRELTKVTIKLNQSLNGRFQNIVGSVVPLQANELANNNRYKKLSGN